MNVPFTGGLELNRAFYEEAVRPILAREFPDLAHGAALVGYGSDVLGYDTARSRDHEWGPRVLLFLDPADLARHGPAIYRALRKQLPPAVAGCSTAFTRPDPGKAGIRVLTAATEGDIDHHVTLWTVDSFLTEELGITGGCEPTLLDWLTFPEQKLLQVTAGAVFRDDGGELSRMRARYRYHPRAVWLYRLAASWQRISQEEAFLGRARETGDERGGRVVAARLVRDVMRLCFLLRRVYSPYSKWLGTAFATLPDVAPLGAVVDDVLRALDLEAAEAAMAAAYETVARWQNALGAAPPEDPSVRWFFDRPYTVIDAGRFARALGDAVDAPELQAAMHRVGLIGAVDQWVDAADILTSAASCRALLAVYQGRAAQNE